MGCFHAQPDNRVSSEEYQVYRYIVRYLADSSPRRIILFNDSTLRNDPTPPFIDSSSGTRILIYNDQPPGFFTPRPLDYSVLVAAGTDFSEYRSVLETINQQSYALQFDSMKSIPNIRFRTLAGLKDDTLHLLMSRGEVLTIWVSRVAFNTNRDLAVLYTDHTCGDLCGAGEWFLLKRIGSSWTVLKIVETWMS
jgi:hypothetical protein